MQIYNSKFIQSKFAFESSFIITKPPSAVEFLCIWISGQLECQQYIYFPCSSMPLCPESPLGGADMAVDSRARWEDFHTVPAHVSAAPGIETMRFSAATLFFYSPKILYLTWCNGRADTPLPFQWVPCVELFRIMN